jgi:hypothetical protein
MSQTANVAGAPAATTPSASRRAAHQPPRVWASNAAIGSSPDPGVRCRTAARTLPHGSIGVTGESDPSASAMPAAAIAA